MEKQAETLVMSPRAGDSARCASRMRSDSAELSLTRTFRFGTGAAEWANRVLEIIGEKLRIIPAPHRTTVSVEEKSVTIDALLARTNAGTLDEAIDGLERRRKVHVMGGADPLIRLTRGAWDLHCGYAPRSGSDVLHPWVKRLTSLTAYANPVWARCLQ